MHNHSNQDACDLLNWLCLSPSLRSFTVSGGFVALVGLRSSNRGAEGMHAYLALLQAQNAVWHVNKAMDITQQPHDFIAGHALLPLQLKQSISKQLAKFSHEASLGP